MAKCPRCSRRMVKTDWDLYGVYALCIGCGWTDNGIGRRRAA